ncbi:MAG: hypothetical protein DLM50_03170 [Candidatus Meridianibacter frigidus]|nr:MAG: hypothetical protein DLM50_03170 [Candidatus Eremiobacteraeota bacterium]
MALSARDLRLLYDVAEALNRAPDVERALDETLRIAIELLGFQSGWVWLRSDEETSFYLAASRNLPPYLQEPVRMTGTPCWCIESVLDGDFATKNVDAIECSRLRPAVKKRQTALTRGMAYHASVALKFGDRELGIMNLTAPRFRKVSSSRLRLLTTIAYQTGIAIERARLAERNADLARTQERANLARDLHDTFTQDLTALSLQLEAALQSLQRPENAGRRVKQALELARAGVAQARESVERLSGGALRGRSFERAVSELVRTFTSQTGIQVQVTLQAHPRIEHEEQLYAVLTEALTNVRKHAAAKHVDISMTGRNGIRLRVDDDGAGYLPRSARKGFGVAGMRERAELIGGGFSIRKRRPRGTRVEVGVQ